MKKFLSVGLFAFVLAAGCSPLRIVMNSHNEDGSRILLTSDKHLFGDFSVALGTKLNQRDTIMGILVTCDKPSDHGIFVKGDKMMFRLTDDSVITLENLYDREYDRETTTQQTTQQVNSYGYTYSYHPFLDGFTVMPYEISSFVPRTYVTTTTNSYALYLISWDELESIVAKGVKKVRIEIEDAEKDSSDTENVSKMFSDMIDCLREGVATNMKHTEF